MAGGALLGTLFLGYQLSRGLLVRLRSEEEERQLGAIASRVGVDGVLPPVSPIIDKNTGRAVALVVVSSDGRQLLATVDAQRPSRLLLKDREGRVYALQTRVDRVNINNQLAMEVLFNNPSWEQQLQQLR